jgi:GGDEF domain-containing protein/CHASE3 domain sensor protein
LLAYLAMAALAALSSVYAIYHLRDLNRLTRAIVQEDFFVMEQSKRMLDNLLALENASKKYLIFREPSFVDIYATRSGEFQERLAALKKQGAPGLDPILARVEKDFDLYQRVFRRETELTRAGLFDEATALSDREGRNLMEGLAASVRQIQRLAEGAMNARMDAIAARGAHAGRMTLLWSLLGLLLGLGLAVGITLNISRPLKRLESVAGEIAEGRFDHALPLRRHDEVGRLARAFSAMAARLKELEVRNLDADPLTGLPGNMAIERQLERRLAERQVFSLCQVDLDNFKPFADKYGYAWASEVIKEVGLILGEQRDALGEKSDFVGHVGGDDFILIASPERMERIGREAILAFELRSQRFYTPQDRIQGFILGKDRNGKMEKFPLITITLAVVTDPGGRFKSPLDMAMTVAELKEYAKTLPGSNFVKEEACVSCQGAAVS